MSGTARRDRSKTFGPIGLFRRASTALFKVRNLHVSNALMMITSSNGITTPERIIASMKCSRRLAETRFREATGKSILEYIHGVRFECAKSLLRQRHVPLSDIPERVGYRSQASFGRFFRAMSGETPGKFRQCLP